MPTAVTGVASATPPAAAGQTRQPKQEMDGEMFLQLLITQLSNQDPSSPMDTNQMISQTTQLATMEQLTALTQTADEAFGLQMRTAAAALIGNQATYTDPATGEDVTGEVTAVSYTNAVPTVTINDTQIALDLVSSLSS